MRMLAAALRRHIGDRAFQNLEQRLLNAFAAHVTGDRRVLIFLRDLVDLVDVNDSLLRLLHIAVGGLQQFQDDILHILANVPGFGQRRRVNDGERHVEHARKRLREERFPRPRGTNQKDIRLAQLNFARLLVQKDALVMIVDRNRQFLLRALLPDYVAVEKLLDLRRAGKPTRRSRCLFPLLVLENLLTNSHALIADVRPRIVRRRTDQLLYLLLGLMTEGTAQGLIWAVFFHL